MIDRSPLGLECFCNAKPQINNVLVMEFGLGSSELARIQKSGAARISSSDHIGYCDGRLVQTVRDTVNQAPSCGYTMHNLTKNIELPCGAEGVPSIQ